MTKVKLPRGTALKNKPVVRPMDDRPGTNGYPQGDYRRSPHNQTRRVERFRRDKEAADREALAKLKKDRGVKNA